MIARSLAVRIAFASLVSGVIGAVIALGFVGRVMSDALSSQLAPLLIARYDAWAGRSCRSQPATWSMRGWLIPELQGYAYEARTGASANPSAAPLRRDLVERLGPNPHAFEVDQREAGSVGTLVFRTGDPAPCELVQLTWRSAAGEQRVAHVVIGSGLASAVFACALGLVVIVVPLVRRLRRLGAAASRVGEAEGYTARSRPAQGDGGDEGDEGDEGNEGDEIDALRDVLDRAHFRIRNDARLLEDQREALERHLARIAHDLRTPLTSLQIALEYAADLSSEPPVRTAIAEALRDTVYVAALTHNLSLASKLRSGWNPTDDVSDVDLGELAARIVGRAQILARRRQIELGLSLPDDPVRVWCNPVAIEQALANIIDNAVAYNDPHGHVAVVLTARAGGFDLEVRDDGPGIVASDLPRLGQVTFRSDEARERDPRGSGLGLAITTEVCARIGWELSFTPLQPRGLLVQIRGGDPAPAG
jgi:signal transduction histidine kinase